MRHHKEVLYMTDFVSLISNVGFPIAACAYMAVTYNKTISQLTDVINNNTLSIERLAGKIDGSENE